MSKVNQASAPVHPNWNLFDEPSSDELPPWTSEDAAWVAEFFGEAMPEPGGPLPFDRWIELQAAAYRTEGTTAGAWLAAELDQLALLARHLGVKTPDEFDGRRADDEARFAADCYCRGVEAARRAAGEQQSVLPFGHN